MWIILLSLLAGIIIGIVKILPDRIVRLNSRFQQAGIILLLFSMGASIGANKELIYNLRSMGIKAAAFAVITSICCVIVSYFVTTKFMGVEKEE